MYEWAVLHLLEILKGEALRSLPPVALLKLLEKQSQLLVCSPHQVYLSS